MSVLDFLLLLKNRWYIVLAISVLAAAGTAVYCWTMMEDQYTASVDLYILSKSGTDDDKQQVTQSDMVASQQLANDVAVLASSSKVKRNTADALEMDSLDEYKINIKSSMTNRVITLSVTGLTPEETALVANELGTQLSKTATEIMELKAVNIIDNADVPTEPSGPKRIQYTLIAFALGIAVSVILLVVMELFNFTFRTPEEIEKAFNIPVIGRLPKIKQ